MSVSALGLTLSVAVFMALGLSACEKAEELAPPAPLDTSASPAVAAPAATLIDASGAMAEMQSAALEQDATAALSDAASAAVGLAKEAGK